LQYAQKKEASVQKILKIRGLQNVQMQYVLEIHGLLVAMQLHLIVSNTWLVHVIAAVLVEAEAPAR
jgi:uncharacterized membrane protein YecN with MAPEG domain